MCQKIVEYYAYSHFGSYHTVKCGEKNDKLQILYCTDCFKCSECGKIYDSSVTPSLHLKKTGKCFRCNFRGEC